MSASSDFREEHSAVMNWFQLFRLLFYVTVISYVVISVFEALFAARGDMP
jgi:hypothetical protein